MDGALSKIGLYDFLGVFLSGMITVLIGIYIGLPYMNFGTADNDIFQTIFFLTGSYFIGLFIRDISVILDYRVFKISKKANTSFLNQRSYFVSDLDLSDFRRMANKLLGKEEGNVDFNQTENEYVYQYCTAWLNMEKKDDEFNAVNAGYAMRRTMAAACLVLAVTYSLVHPESFSVFVLIVFFALALFFYMRAKTFSRYRVRVLMRYCRTIWLDQQRSKENN